MAAELNTVFGALADPTRRRVLEILREAPRPAGEIADRAGVSRAAMSHHLRVLSTVGLVRDDRGAQDARLRIFRLDPARIGEAESWLRELRTEWETALHAFQRHVETRERGGA